MPKFYTQFDKPPRVIKFVEGVTMTQQHFKDECDINNIIRRYAPDIDDISPVQVRSLLAQDPQFISASGTGTYGDFSSLEDLQVSKNKQIESFALFAKLPVDVRAHFGHNPEIFLEFASREPDKLVQMFPRLAKPKSAVVADTIMPKTDDKEA